jgi:DNA-binding transcriptional MerR regulator
MLIGEISKHTGLSRDTIRFYEKKGLIKVPRKQRRDNNYKEYPENIIERLTLIKSIQDYGFTLKEIETFFELWQEENASCANLLYTLENKVAQVNDQIERLNQLKNRLTSSLLKCKSNECEFERSVPSCVKKC